MSFPYVICMVLVAISMYCILCKRNLIKIVIGLTVLGDSVNLFLICLGYKFGGIPPIITEEYLRNLPVFFTLAVDPLPQAFVLTAIVINMSITALALALAVKIYQYYGTLDTTKIRRLKG